MFTIVAKCNQTTTIALLITLDHEGTRPIRVQNKTRATLYHTAVESRGNPKALVSHHWSPPSMHCNRIHRGYQVHSQCHESVGQIVLSAPYKYFGGEFSIVPEELSDL